ncbi:VOC family protein [Microbulbifer magnicolonia]|uniref:VOC family protein n=1 Tax=Microbulbifer magnicolonia TaxID=3109744 RepID=UPI002B40EFFD|nr:VOC family protein [Microbulbifer sp. GG15]
MTQNKSVNANPSLMSHISIGTNRFHEAVSFYDKILSVLGARRILDFPEAVAYGKVFPEFWVHPPHDGEAASVGNGTHFAFLADSPESVDRFYSAAIRAGATPEGEPGARPQYGDAYYGCFLRDPDGHKIEAMHWDERKAQPA